MKLEYELREKTGRSLSLKMTIAYEIFSGGLDSLLSARVLMEQGIEVRLLTFTTPFFNAHRASLSSRRIGQSTRAVEIT